jgi:hypothetical protein
MAAESLERYTHEEARSDEAINIEEVSQAPLKDYQHRETNGDTDIHFGQFCALPLSRQLLLDGNPVEIGRRAFACLWC